MVLDKGHVKLGEGYAQVGSDGRRGLKVPILIPSDRRKRVNLMNMNA